MVGQKQPRRKRIKLTILKNVQWILRLTKSECTHAASLLIERLKERRTANVGTVVRWLVGWFISVEFPGTLFGYSGSQPIEFNNRRILIHKK